MDNSLEKVRPSALEIISPPLWSPGYSIYRTAFCKKWVSLVILDPGFKVNTLCVDTLYNTLKIDWDLHHYPNTLQNLPIPNYPHLYQFQDAVKYFYYKNVVINSITPSFKLSSEHQLFTDSKPKRLLVLASASESPKKGVVQGILDILTKKIF